MNIGANTRISQSPQAAQHQAQQKRNPAAQNASPAQDASSPPPQQPPSRAQPVTQSQPPANNSPSHSSASSSGNTPQQGSTPQRTPQPNDAQSALALINGVPQHQLPQQNPPHASSRTGQNVNITA
ncbi:MAG: hypothetical protein KGI82_05335 [Betaproteobacteria bacterium]|nr:hypothetical protein [Betaproteobacteria bacterium]